jgi:ferredoxin
MEKAGVPFRLALPHKAFNARSARSPTSRVRPTGASSADGMGDARARMAPTPEDRAFVASLMGRRRNTGQFANWIAPPAMGSQQATGGLRIRSLQLEAMSQRIRDRDDSRDGTVEVLRQHLIDPEICIRCNTCEETCPIDAITHDARNYVVDAAICNSCNACISPCPTGAIDNWRQVVRANAVFARGAALLGHAARAAGPSVDAAPDVPQDIARLTAAASAAREVWLPRPGRPRIPTSICTRSPNRRSPR